ncbi:hypothetical protein CXG46_12750 [Nocardioides alpinus]|uniref:SipW-cognate class signal peptide n=1 Tax=Nocardioides alpinus TaxID=748909 RepID=A0ABX4QWV3_9ACTN|nr:hypothetical protein CXG46_12750 [Nocardioides alpinus]
MVAVAATAPAYAASPLGAQLTFNTANVFGADYAGSRPKKLESNVQVQNSYYAGAPTVTSLILTVSYPKTVVGGGAATSVSGVGWSYTSVASSGTQWVYRFDWVGTAAPGGNTGTMVFRVPIVNPYPGAVPVTPSFTASASGGTALAAPSYTLPS